MEIKNVVALIREESVDPVVKCLQEAQVKGFTITSTKGIGEYNNHYGRDLLNTCARLDVMISADKAEFIAELIMDAAHSGLDGDGLIAIQSVDKLYRITERQELEAFP